jgi:hypothetical protein
MFLLLSNNSYKILYKVKSRTNAQAGAQTSKSFLVESFNKAASKCWKTLCNPNSENGRKPRHVLMTCTLCEDLVDEICLRRSWTVRHTSLTAISTGYFIRRHFQFTSRVSRETRIHLRLEPLIWKCWWAVKQQTNERTQSISEFLQLC